MEDWPLCIHYLIAVVAFITLIIFTTNRYRHPVICPECGQTHAWTNIADVESICSRCLPWHRRRQQAIEVEVGKLYRLSGMSGDALLKEMANQVAGLRGMTINRAEDLAPLLVTIALITRNNTVRHLVVRDILPQIAGLWHPVEKGMQA